MRAKRHFQNRLLSLVLAFLAALAMAVPAMAADTLTIRINNAEGLPAMTAGQFTAYQVFKGKANKDKEGADSNEWGANSWNNWSLADIKWGDDIDTPEKLVNALKSVTEEKWPEFFKEKQNVFKDLNYVGSDAAASAEALAKILVDNNKNSFLQAFSEFIVHGKAEARGNGGDGYVKDGIKSVQHNQADKKDDYSTITVSAPGYYLVAQKHPTEENAVSSEFILAVLGDQTINMKADIPTVDKEIVTSDTPSKGDVAGVGDTVKFSLTGSVAKDIDIYTTYKYIFTDTLSKGMTYQYDAKVYILREGQKKEITAGYDATPAKPVSPAAPYPAPAEDTEIKITFEDLKGITVADTDPFVIKGTDEIVVEYSAVLNENAVIGSTGNLNTAQLEYSNNPHSAGTGKSNTDLTRVFSFGLDLTKIGSDREHATGLKGAGFVLKNANGDYAIFADQTVPGGSIRRLTGWTGSLTSPSTSDVTGYIESGSKEQLANYLLESGEKGAIPDVYGLDAGTDPKGITYTLKEVITPDGYNTMDDYEFTVSAVIDESGNLTSVTYKAKGEEEGKTYNVENDKGDGDNAPFKGVFSSGLLPDTIVNQKAPFLPFTGGTGAVIFYVLGTVLIAGAVTYLVIMSKKRRKNEDKA